MTAAITLVQGDAIQSSEYSRDQLDLIKRTLARDLSDAEFAYFIEVAKRLELDVFRKQVYAVKLGGKLTIQTGIDGFRAIASRSGQYEGQAGPFWCADDGVWRDAWLEKGPPVAAKVGVYRKGFREPVWGVARFASYAGTNLWSKMPEVMIAKCAEALALRKAFPEALSGVYTSDEMDQAKSGKTVTPVASVPTTPDGEVIEEEPLDEQLLESVREAFAGRIASAESVDDLRVIHKEMMGSRLPGALKQGLKGELTTRRNDLERM